MSALPRFLRLPRFAALGLLSVAAGALFAFGVGHAVGEFRGLNRDFGAALAAAELRGEERQRLRQALEIERLKAERLAADRAAGEALRRERDAGAARTAAERRRYEEALNDALRDPGFGALMRLPLPSGLRLAPVPAPGDGAGPDSGEDGAAGGTSL